jgi:hypothetical protein
MNRTCAGTVHRRVIIWVDVPGQLRHGATHDFRFLLEEPYAFVRFPQLRGVIGQGPDAAPSSLSAIFIQRCSAAGDTRKSLAVRAMGASPLRVTATTSRRNSSGKTLGMMTRKVPILAGQNVNQTFSSPTRRW